MVRELIRRGGGDAARAFAFCTTSGPQAGRARRLANADGWADGPLRAGAARAGARSAFCAIPIFAIAMAAALALAWPESEARAACLPLAPPPDNSTVTCSNNTTNANGTNGYGTGVGNGVTINVQGGASVIGSGAAPTAGLFLGANNTINNSGAITDLSGVGINALTVTSTAMTVNNLTATSSITGAGVAIGVAGTATVTNAGSITAHNGVADGIVADVTTVTNSGTISATATSATGNAFAIIGNTSVTVVNSGSISATSASTTTGPTNAIVGGTVNVTNTSTGTISASGNQAFAISANLPNVVATIVNAGTISGTDTSGSSNGGIFTVSSANVTNSGSISGNGINSFALFIGGNLTLVNTGSVSANGNAFNGVQANGNATITNSGSGTISATGDFVFAIVAVNVNLTNSASVSANGQGSQGVNAFFPNIVNSGSITASGVGSVGVRGRTGPIMNSGMISGEIGIQTSANGIVGTENGLAVTNSGTIIGTGGTAIDFTSPRLDTLTIAPTSVITGNVLAGAGDTFQLGGNGSGAFDLNTIGAAKQYRGFTAFNVVSGTWTVSNTFGQAQAWNVNGGTLAGTGTLSSVNVNNGGTLAPGLPGTAGGTLSISGNLVMASAATYLVNVSQSASLAKIAGTAALAGTAQAAFVGSASQHQYAILSAAGGRNGTFSNLVTVNLPVFISASLVYTPTEVDLVLNSSLAQISQLTGNQAAVLAAFNHAFNSGGGFLAGLGGVSPGQFGAALNALSGEGLSGTQEAAFGAGGTFLTAMMEQGAFWRNGETGGAGSMAMSYAAEKPVPAVFKAMPKGMPLKAPMFEPRWRAWTAGFDGVWSLKGEADPGSANLTHRSAGGAAGVDYQIAPDLLVGAAAAGSASNFSVPDRATGGTLYGAHAGAYAVARRDGWYTAASVAFAAFDNKTSRTIAGVGPTEVATASFNSNLLSGRLEAGVKYGKGGLAVTPFAAVQFAQLWQAGFAESSAAAGGPGVLGLAVPTRAVSSLPTFAGVQLDNRVALPNGMIWTPYARVSWVHEHDPSRAIAASFITLPGAAFTVDGPRAARDAARIDAGSKLAISRTVSLFDSFDGEFSGRSQMYAGKGGVLIEW